jgi:CSLREA domain-containing protein
MVEKFAQYPCLGDMIGAPIDSLLRIAICKHSDRNRSNVPDHNGSGARLTLQADTPMTGDSFSTANTTALVAIAGAGLAAMIALLAVTIASSARATRYTVDTLLDTNGASECSLRDAINAANGSPTSGSTCTTAGTGTSDPEEATRRLLANFIADRVCDASGWSWLWVRLTIPKRAALHSFKGQQVLSDKLIDC